MAQPRPLDLGAGVHHDTEPGVTGRYPFVDEYALASRLSYFLWSSMPDDELLRLAGEHKLRENLDAQLAQMTWPQPVTVAVAVSAWVLR